MWLGTSQFNEHAKKKKDGNYQQTSCEQTNEACVTKSTNTKKKREYIYLLTLSESKKSQQKH